MKHEVVKEKVGSRTVYCSLTYFSDQWPTFATTRAGKSVIFIDELIAIWSEVVVSEDAQ